MTIMTAEQMMQRPDVLAYLNELAADIVANGGIEVTTIENALQIAHDNRQLFAAEMAVGETRRAKMARAAIGTSVWIAFNADDSKRRMVRACELIEG